MKSTPFSEFIRSQDSAYKAKIFAEVLEGASKRQKEMLEKRRQCQNGYVVDCKSS